PQRRCSMSANVIKFPGRANPVIAADDDPLEERVNQIIDQRLAEPPDRIIVHHRLPAQPVDATQALNLSAGVSNCKVSRGRSFSWQRKSGHGSWPPAGLLMTRYQAKQSP